MVVYGSGQIRLAERLHQVLHDKANHLVSCVLIVPIEDPNTLDCTFVLPGLDVKPYACNWNVVEKHNWMAIFFLSWAPAPTGTM
jgi:hypothetical protein